jgi:predicted transporter
MGILLAFAPFIAFVVVERLVGVSAGLIAATVVSALLLVRSIVARQSIKVLELGSFVLFASLAVYATLLHPVWSVIAVRLRVDAGLLLIVLLSIAIRRPFTLQYAREKVPAELWQSAEFIRINYVITAVWALAFAVITAVEAAILYIPSISQKAGVWIAILVIYGAFRFTEEYPKRQQASAG